MSIFKNVRLASGEEISFIVREDACNRLKTRCFRGEYVMDSRQSVCRWESKKLAGNFMYWRTPGGPLFQLEQVARTSFLKNIEGILQENSTGTHSVSVICSKPVGWESTAPLENYRMDVLETFEPNGRSTALRVKKTHTDILAPKTNEFTVVMEFKRENGKGVFVVHSMYPGKDIGALIGDVTKREGRIFFDWDHPVA